MLLCVLLRTSYCVYNLMVIGREPLKNRQFVRDQPNGTPLETHYPGESKGVRPDLQMTFNSLIHGRGHDDDERCITPCSELLLSFHRLMVVGFNSKTLTRETSDRLSLFPVAYREW